MCVRLADQATANTQVGAPGQRAFERAVTALDVPRMAQDEAAVVEGFGEPKQRGEERCSGAGWA